MTPDHLPKGGEGDAALRVMRIRDNIDEGLARIAHMRLLFDVVFVRPMIDRMSAMLRAAPKD